MMLRRFFERIRFRRTTERAFSRPMTAKEVEMFDRAFEQFDVVFKNMDAAFKEMRKHR
jgi:hypothetical protein